jgi:ketosteroid isomerase-like protein
VSARTISELHERLTSAINSGNVDDILELYEDDATFIFARAPVSGKAAIKAAFLEFLALNPRFRIESSTALEGGGDLALLEARWAWDGSGPTGFPMRMTGTSREVARRGPDGNWRYAIDDPGAS